MQGRERVLAVIHGNGVDHRALEVQREAVLVSLVVRHAVIPDEGVGLDQDLPSEGRIREGLRVSNKPPSTARIRKASPLSSSVVGSKRRGLLMETSAMRLRVFVPSHEGHGEPLPMITAPRAAPSFRNGFVVVS